MDFKKNLLSLAVATVVASGPVAAVAADVVNLLGSEAGKLNVSLRADFSKRDMEQDGRADLYSELVDVYNLDEFTEVELTESIGISNLKGEEKQQHLYLQIDYAVTPRIQLYGKGGIARTKLSNLKGGLQDYTLTEDVYSEGTYVGSLTESDTYALGGDLGGFDYSDWGVVLGLGANILLHEWTGSGWRTGLDLSYQYKKSDMNETYDEGGLSVQMKDAESQEWQAALIMSKAVGRFQPFFGVKYAKATTSYDGMTETWFSEHSWSLDMENKQPWGLFAGFDYELTPGMGLTASVRGLDDTAANIGLKWKF